jgi:hypothetical protein
MYDSINPLNIPVTAELVASYLDYGPKEGWNTPGARERFPNSIQVDIVLSAQTLAGQVLDVETGAALPTEAPSWVLSRRAHGVEPTVYMNFSTWPAVRQAFRDQNVVEPLYWTAGYATPPDPTIPPGAVAHQYCDPASGSGGHYDLSSVLDYWIGVDTLNTGLKEFYIQLCWLTTTGHTAATQDILTNGDGKRPGTKDIFPDGSNMNSIIAVFSSFMVVTPPSTTVPSHKHVTGATGDVAP